MLNHNKKWKLVKWGKFLVNTSSIVVIGATIVATNINAKASDLISTQPASTSQSSAPTNNTTSSTLANNSQSSDGNTALTKPVSTSQNPTSTNNTTSSNPANNGQSLSENTAPTQPANTSQNPTPTNNTTSSSPDNNGQSSGKNTAPTQPADKPKVGWIENADNTYSYFSKDDGHMVTGPLTLDGKVYDFDKNGKQLKGAWSQNADNTYSYFSKDDGHIVTGPLTLNGKNLMFDKNGKQLKGAWSQNADNTWSYFSKDDGHMVTGPLTLDGKNLMFDKNGKQLKGAWIQNADNTYSYFNKDDGHMVTGPLTLNGKVYDFDKNGKQLKGAWIQNADNTYSYFSKDDGHMVTGPLTLNGKNLMFDKNGKQLKGAWIQNADNTYSYFSKDDGHMVTGPLTLNGKNLMFDKNGKQLKGAWIQNADESYSYYDKNTGNQLTGVQKVDGQTYDFDQTGKQLKGAWVQNADNTYSYFSKDDGHMVTGPLTLDGKNLMFDKNGKQLKGAWSQNADNTYSYFSKDDGHMVTGPLTLDNRHLIFDQNGKQLKGAWIENADNTYSYFSKDDGHLLTGPAIIDGKSVIFDQNGEQIKGAWAKGADGNYHYYDSDKGEEDITKHIVATNTTTDKSSYNPGDNVNFYINLSNVTVEPGKADVKVNIYHLNNYVTSIDAGTISIGANGQIIKKLTWKTPNKDYQGYRAEVVVDGDIDQIRAVDVSSDWTKFPRYGSLTTFTKADDGKPNIDRLAQMKDNYVNAVEYYDAYMTPQEPFPVNNVTDDYTQDWAPWLGNNNWKSGQTVKDTVDAGHNLYNMRDMIYNMIYAITGDASSDDYLKSIGVKKEWILYNSEGPNKDQMVQNDMAPWMTDPSVATQTYLDIRNPEVVDWIVKVMGPALYQLNFDGWHGDTIGNNDLVHPWGKPDDNFRLGDYLGQFADAVKQRLGNKKFAVNTVSQYGQDKVATSAADLQYSETWTGDYNYISQIIKETANLGGKSLILPAYVQKNEANRNGKEFNPNTTLILDSVAYAAGGGRVEIVDGDHLLDDEFFPNKDLHMSDNLKARFHNYQTFITAYENLLRDGQHDNFNGVELYDVNGNPMNRSDNAAPNSVFAYSRSSDNSETIQLINLMGVTDMDWKGNSGNQVKPTEQYNFHVHYYPSKDRQRGESQETHHVYIESPDGKDANRSTELPFKWGHNQYGDYLDIQVPSLEYWDMLHITA